MQQSEIDKIVLAAIYRGIYKFDVSGFRGVGGWSYNPNKNLHSTLDYDQIANCILTHWK